MLTSEGELVGSVGDVGPSGDEWGFSLYDGEERELLAFMFNDEHDARAAAKAMQEVMARVVALAPADERGFIAVPVVRG
jgi:hypothetical protein